MLLDHMKGGLDFTVVLKHCLERFSSKVNLLR